MRSRHGEKFVGCDDFAQLAVARNRSEDRAGVRANSLYKGDSDCVAKRWQEDRKSKATRERRGSRTLVIQAGECGRNRAVKWRRKGAS
jgi:hypothetical protein